MVRVVEGIYEDGKINLVEKIDIKTSKVILVILKSKKEKGYLTKEKIDKLKSLISNLPEIKSKFDIEELYHEAKMHRKENRNFE